MNQDEFVHLIFTELWHFHEASLALIWGIQNYQGPSPQANTQACYTNSLSRSKVPPAFHLHDINLLLLYQGVLIFPLCNIPFRTVICACWKLTEITLLAKVLKNLKSNLKSP